MSIKFNSPEEQIDYLKGRVAGLEESLEELLELLSPTTDELIGSTKAFANGLQTSTTKRSAKKHFDLTSAARTLDVGNQISLSTVETELMVCWQFAKTK